MDAGAVSSVIFNLINAIFIAFTLTFWGLFSLLHLLASPLLYVAHGLLALVLSPLQLLVKFEVIPFSEYSSPVFNYRDSLRIVIPLLCDWGHSHGSHHWLGSISYQ